VIPPAPDEETRAAAPRLALRAIQMVERLTEVSELGRSNTGTVRAHRGLRRLRRDHAGTDGLLHIST